MATNTEPWGSTPLTTEGLASLGHPLSLGDFNQDASGRYWRMIRGEKTYYPREWFDAKGTFTGSGTQAGDRAGQDTSFFKQGMKWNWQTGQWENPTNWANVIGTTAAGVVGAGIAAPAIGAALGGGATTAGGAGTAAGSSAALNPAVFGGALAGPVAPAAAGGGVMSSVGSYLLGNAGGGAGSGALLPLIGTGLNFLGQEQALGANKDALSQQLASTKYASDAQSKSAADQLAFLRQEQAYNAQVAEANRAGNYDQWAARQEMLGPVGQALGLPARRIPAYVPLPVDPNSLLTPGGTTPAPLPGTLAATAPGPTPAPTGSAPAPVSAANGDIRTQVANYYKARGVTPNPTSVDYWASKWQEFGAKDPAYFNTRLAQADEFGGGGAPAPAAAAPRVQPLTTAPLGSVAGYLDPTSPFGQLQMPTVRPYYAGPVGSYLA